MGTGADNSTLQAAIEALDGEHRPRVVLFSKTTCGYCGRVKMILDKLGITDAVVFELDMLPGGREVQEELHRRTGIFTVPNLFVNGVNIGDSQDVWDAFQSGQLADDLREAGYEIPE